jgi:DNA mismatch endonuclease (patch repair protein)
VTDKFNPKKRSEIMARVKGRDTGPEKIVRSLLHRMGYRFRLHQRDLPGNPDIVLTRHGKVIFVHGCFWHGHRRCSRASRPVTNTDFWNKKLERNIKRDSKTGRRLRSAGWSVMIIWQCQIRNTERLRSRLERFISHERCQSK